MKTSNRQSRKQILAGSQNGQAIVLVALLILVLFGMLGLAIDSGRAYVDRRDQQAAVDAAALAAGDWYENFSDLYGSTLPNSKAVYESNLHMYGGPASDSDTTTFVGVNNNLQQDTDTLTFPNAYTLTIVATDTQFNGYQFNFTSCHALPLAFMQLFGGSPTITICATATAIVGNQRQTPALLTLSTDNCALNLKGSATLTLLGDAYSNGTACGLQPPGGRQLLRSGRLQLQLGHVLLLQRVARVHALPAALQPRRHPGRADRARPDAARPRLPEQLAALLRRAWLPGVQPEQPGHVDRDDPGHVHELPPHRWLCQLRVPRPGHLRLDRRVLVGRDRKPALQRAEGPR